MHRDRSSCIRVGPAGWSYGDWKGVVYPKSLPRGTHPLELIASWFDTVEVNVSFYRTLDPQLARSWVAKVADNPRFRFTAKLWRRFTHDSGSFPGRSEIAEYSRGITPLMEAGVLGAVLVQYPWSFKRTRENRAWLARLIDAFEEFPLAVEMRHASWNCEELHAGLRERGVAVCNIDQPVLRDCIEPAQVATAPLAYVRFHGRNGDAWFADNVPSHERYNYLYSEQELNPWIARLRALGNQSENVYAITNNHYQGKAVVNAFEIMAALGQPFRRLPDDLVRAYPRLGRLATNREPATDARQHA